MHTTVHEKVIHYVTCADIGGSHITAAVMNMNDKTIVDQSFVRLEVNSKGTAANIISTWIEALKKANVGAGLQITHAALAMPGPFDYENGISYIRGLNKYEAIYGLNVKQLLAEELRIDPENIKFRNDAEATIAGEVLAGAGVSYQNVMGVTLGTGFGSAQFTDGFSRDLNLGSRLFKDALADDYLSTRWFLKRHYELTGMPLTGGVKALAAIADGNNTARDIFREFALNMSAFLTEPVFMIKPEVIIMCGNIAKASPFFLPLLKRRLKCNIKLALLGEQAALIGAAALFQSA